MEKVEKCLLAHVFFVNFLVFFSFKPELHKQDSIHPAMPFKYSERIYSLIRNLIPKANRQNLEKKYLWLLSRLLCLLDNSKGK